MAVIQISKIQVRRGKKSSNSGVPQLSSAEFAWAVDTQELFIGNGSVAEGAPYVGNTKILTEHDNLLALAGSYTFDGSPSVNIYGATPRSLQAKLDETVSVKDFGAQGDGVTDDTAAFQLALDQLFRNANPTYKKTLLVPNGTYILSPSATAPLLIPPGAVIKGETQDNTIINISSANVLTENAAGQTVAFYTSTAHPKNIKISNLTISRTTGSLVLTGVSDSVLEDVTFLGTYVLGTTVSNIDTEPAALFWNNTLAGIATNNITIKNCRFQQVSTAVHCIQTAAFDTNVKFIDCKFFVNNLSIYINGVINQGNYWEITDCSFEEVAAQAFYSTHGSHTAIKRSTFKNVGTSTFNAATPTGNMIIFGDQDDNTVVDCYADRQQAAGIVSADTIGYIPEVVNSVRTNLINRNSATIYLSDSARPLAVFSAFTSYIFINYRLELSTFNRFGTLMISIDTAQTQVSITDHYQYSPNFVTSTGGTMMTNFEFSVALKDNLSSAGNDTVVLYYKNPIATGYTGTISFDVAYGV